MKRLFSIILIVFLYSAHCLAQINTDRVLAIGRNALYFEDYVLSIQYFNDVISVKPHLPEPFLYRSIAKVYLDDYSGAAEDATSCIERNPFITTAYQVRGIARQNLKDYEGAIEDFSEGLKIQPENKVFLRNLGVSYALKKDYQRADSCFESFISIFPSEPTAYLTRAQLRMEMKDSIGALENLNKALALDKSSAYAFALRGMIFEDQEKHSEAIEDMDMAIKLDPEQVSYYINRGLIKYNTNDIRGALQDYDAAIELDPSNVISLYNRGLLRAQLGDRNKAISDFSAVLEIEPLNTFASYNRAILRDEVGDWRGAIQDYTDVFAEHPNFFPALYARSEDNRKLGRAKAADDDYKQAWLVEQRVKKERDARDKRRKEMLAQGVQNPDSILYANNEDLDTELDDESKTRQETDRNIRKFNRIMTASNDDRATKYSSEVRGRIQDKNFSVDLQPMFLLSYYEKDDIHKNIYFEKTISDFNRAGLLTRRLKAVCNEPMLTQAQAKAHFASIDDYSRMIDFSGGSLIAFFGRSLDFLLVQDYQNAISDLNQVLMRKDNFILAYFNRAVVRYRQIEVSDRAGVVNARAQSGDDELKNSALAAIGSQASQSAHTGNFGTIKINSNVLSAQEKARIEAEQLQQQRRLECNLALRDLDKVIELSPTFVYAYYNRAFISSKLNNLDAAIEDLNKAIELYPGFAEAYYNRGLILLRMGKTRQGIQDLSKAGELGLAMAYSVMKRAQSE
ncbi:MAG: tetratricopeptide repeat protein [Bacteroidales bacterium]|nr:tetratricopeptide repeat protein [Bacteroidales bacterium]